MPEARGALSEIYRRTGRAHVIGLTGVLNANLEWWGGAMGEKFADAGVKLCLEPLSPPEAGRADGAV